MRVTALIQRQVVTCSAQDALARAAQLMWEHDLGCLPVVDGQGHLLGMITDRDICMAAYTQGRPLHALPVTGAMATQVVACSAADEVEAVARTMREHQLRRVPVVDDQGELVGVLSIHDLARAAALELVPAAEVVTTLAAIAAPREVR